MTNTLMIQDFLTKISGREVPWKWKAPWIISNCLPTYRASYPRRFESSPALLWASRISHSNTTIPSCKDCMYLSSSSHDQSHDKTLCSRRICMASESSL